MSQGFTFSKLNTMMATVVILSALNAFFSMSSVPNPRKPTFAFFSLNVWNGLTLAMLAITGLGHYPISWPFILLPMTMWLATGIGVVTGALLASLCGHREEHLAEAVAAGIKLAHFEEMRDQLPEPVQQLVKARATWAKHSPLGLLADPEKPIGIERLYRTIKLMQGWKRWAVALIVGGTGVMNAVDGYWGQVVLFVAVVGIAAFFTAAGASISRKADAVRAFRGAGSQVSSAAA